MLSYGDLGATSLYRFFILLSFSLSLVFSYLFSVVPILFPLYAVEDFCYLGTPGGGILILFYTALKHIDYCCFMVLCL